MPAQTEQSSQVEPVYGGSHVHFPHSQIPLALHNTWLFAIQEAVSMEQLQSLPTQPSSQTQCPHSHLPWPPQILLDETFSLKQRVVLEQKNVLITTHNSYTCCSSMNSQSCCTGSRFRKMFHPGLRCSRTHRSPPDTHPYRCKRGHLGLSDNHLHLVTKMNRGPSGTVVQHKAHSTHTGHTLEPRGHCSQGYFPGGFLCSHTDLGKQILFNLPHRRHVLFFISSILNICLLRFIGLILISLSNSLT